MLRSKLQSARLKPRRYVGAPTHAFQLAILVALNLAFASSARAQQWNQGDPTADEQYALEVLNRVRMDPAAAMDFYIKQSATNAALKSAIAGRIWMDPASGARLAQGEAAEAPYIQNVISSYNKTVGISRTALPRAPLALYPMFSEQAKSRESAFAALPNFFFVGTPIVANSTTIPLLQIIGPNAGTTPSLSGQNATGGIANIRAGKQDSTGQNGRGEYSVGINLYSSNLTLREAYAGGPIGSSWFDETFTWVQTGSGPTATFAYGKMRMVGISLGNARVADPGTGSRILTMFGTDSEAFTTSDLPFGASTIFVTGVAYQDNDSNGDYTPGEGLPNVKVILSSGAWFAVTATAGGYAIPVQPNSGSITVTAEGFAPVTVSVGSNNVKIDFIKAAPPPVKPAQVLVPASTGSATLGNLSARGVADVGSNALIVGFVITGTGNKTLLIRGIGPALKTFGVPGALRWPSLTLYDSTGKALGTNNGWYGENTRAVSAQISAAATSVGAFALDPFDLDSAMLVTLPPGGYTAVVSPTLALNGASTGSGTALAEVYDVSKTDGSRLINLSTRGNIAEGGQIIVGFVVVGQGTKRVLVRGIGPTLQAFGITNPASNPITTLYDAASNLLLQNDSWSFSSSTDQVTVLSPDIGAFSLPAGSFDSALLTTLGPGGYSAVIRTKLPGVALVELYEAK